MPPPILPSDIGTPRYYELLHREAAYWERISRGEIDTRVATWRREDLAAATNGDLITRVIDLAVARGPRVLELACGSGGIGIQLARRGCVVDGVDISLGLVETAMRQIHELRQTERWLGNVRLFVSDLNRLALARDTYDVVVAAAALHHVLDLDYLVGEVYAALKPGGTLICLDHMKSSLVNKILRYIFLSVLPTEVPYWKKPIHAFNRLMARVYRRFPQIQAPVAFTLPESSPFEDITGFEAITLIRKQFVVEIYETYLAFTDIVAGHLRYGSAEREAIMARRLHRLDDWLIYHGLVRGDTYYLVARKPQKGIT